MHVPGLGLESGNVNLERSLRLRRKPRECSWQDEGWSGCGGGAEREAGAQAGQRDGEGWVRVQREFFQLKLPETIWKPLALLLREGAGMNCTCAYGQCWVPWTPEELSLKYRRRAEEEVQPPAVKEKDHTPKIRMICFRKVRTFLSHQIGFVKRGEVCCDWVRVGFGSLGKRDVSNGWL